MELTIGEVAGLVDLPVKTVRYYADEGLLPDTRRSSGGHRRFDQRHVARLGLIRALRELDVDLGSIRRLLDRDLDLATVLAAQVELVRQEEARLARRRAVLEAAMTDPSEEVVLRLPLVGRLEEHERVELLEHFWDQLLGDADSRTAASFRAAGIPSLPDDADAKQLLTWLELVELATDRDFIATTRRNLEWGARLIGDREPMEAMAGIQAAVGAAAAAKDEGAFEAAVDAYAAAYAQLVGRRDTPAFRRWLIAELDRVTDPRAARFWQLVAELGGGGPIAGSRALAAAFERVHDRLRAAAKR